MASLKALAAPAALALGAPAAALSERRGLRLALAALIGATTISGCATSRLPAVPPRLVPQADATLGNVAYPVARDVSGFARAGREAIEREQAWYAAHSQPPPSGPANLLAISGGGDGGAFAAGLLNGWTTHGDRPQFAMVTGISTGALIAPFAFLGPRYDPVLKRLYTQISERDIYHPRTLLPALFSDALTDTRPLRDMVRRYVDRPLLDAIAAEYAKGRLLFVGTTNLDTPEPVIWDLTAIAASKDPHALQLFRKVLLASAAVPVIFPPVMIDVPIGGVGYQQMHVDGAVVAQVFAYPPSLRPAEVAASAGSRRPLRLYIIENVQLTPHWESVQRRTLPIANRSISAASQAESIVDLGAIYQFAQRDHIDYNLALIPKSFDAPHRAPYDNAYMRSLYQTGYDEGARGAWRKTPPDYYHY